MAEQDAWAGRKRLVCVDGLAMACVEIAGAEPALLMIHGFTDTSRSFSLMAPHLTGCRLIIPDLRGHGASPAGTSGFKPADFADDIAALIGKLRLERPVLVGHSLGAMIAIELAAKHGGRIGGLVLLAGSLKPGISQDHPMAVGVRGLCDPISPADPFYAYWHACRPGVPQAFLASMATDASAMPAARWRAILEQLCRADLTDTARGVRDDTLVIGGARDPLFGEVHQQALLHALPHASFLRAEGCSHNPHWEDPALVAAAISGKFTAGA
ncbi:MAG: alpha/beta hydrolase [Mesorhizobium sp.]|nr:MAG: alpha/beta hydrolase [Mesorhizobium sp.]